MADYPDSIFSPRERENKSGIVYDAAKKTSIFVEDQNKGDDEVVAIENYLGLPAGHAGEYLKVNAEENAIEFGAIEAANKALSNLENVAINISLIPNLDSDIDLGSTTKYFANAYIDKVYFFQSDAFLQYENIFGGEFISGQSSSGNILRFLSAGDNISINVRSGGALYGLTILANVTYGARLSAVKAGGAGHFVIASATDILPEVDSSQNFGSSTLFWQNIYTDLLHLSPTINIDGSLAGVVKFAGADLRPDGDLTRDLGAENVSTKDQSVETGNASNGVKLAVWLGQGFTTGSAITNISSLDLYLKKGSDVADIFYVDIYLAGGDDKPTGASLGQTSIPAMTNTAYEWKTFTFSPKITLSPSTKYIMVLSSPASTGDQDVYLSTANPYANGVKIRSTNSGVDWTISSTHDLLFKTYTEADLYWAEGYINKLFLNATAILDGAVAGHILFTGDLVPATDDTEWIGEIESPFKSIKGLVIKDTTDGKHYKVEVVSGVLTATALD